MKIDILEVRGRNRDKVIQWLSADKRVKEVKVFDDFENFIRRVENSHPDICLIRLGNNGIPGLKTGAEVRRKSPETRIIFISDDRDYALDAYEIGAFGYLLCPVSRSKLQKYLAGEYGMPGSGVTAKEEKDWRKGNGNPDELIHGITAEEEKVSGTA